MNIYELFFFGTAGKQWASAAALGCAALLTGCAGAPSQGGRLDAPADALSPEERRLQAVETKLTQVQRRLDSINTLRFDDEATRLRDDLRTLRGEIEKSRFELQQADRRSKELYADIDRRLQGLETRNVSVAPAPGAGYTPAYPPPAPSYYPPPQPQQPQQAYVPPPAPPVSAPAVSAPPVSPQEQLASPEEEGAYLASFDLLKSGKYDEAVRGFRGVLDRWPRGRYADNAAYWMGEASFVKRDYNAALAAFQTVVNNHPTSPKVAEAALKVGLTQIELRQTEAARATLQGVVRNYPNSSAARGAQQKLKDLGGGGSAASEAPRSTDNDRPRR